MVPPGRVELPLPKEEDFESDTQEYADLLKRIVSFPKPTVARINGYCLGGGMGLVLACDISIAKKEAKFGTPEINVGLWPMMIGALIFRNVPRKKAMKTFIEIDGKHYEHDALFVYFCNSVWVGGKMMISPNSKFDDGIVEIIVSLPLNKHCS